MPETFEMWSSNFISAFEKRSETADERRPVRQRRKLKKLKSDLEWGEDKTWAQAHVPAHGLPYGPPYGLPPPPPQKKKKIK